MQKQEFKKLMGRNYDDEAFDGLNKAYEELDDMSEQEFCEILKDDPEWLVSVLGKLLHESRTKNEKYLHALKELSLFVFLWGGDKHNSIIRDVFGKAECIKMKLMKNIELNDDEKQYIHDSL